MITVLVKYDLTGRVDFTDAMLLTRCPALRDIVGIGPRLDGVLRCNNGRIQRNSDTGA